LADPLLTVLAKSLPYRPCSLQACTESHLAVLKKVAQQHSLDTPKERRRKRRQGPSPFVPATTCTWEPTSSHDEAKVSCLTCV
jgi:hypothetical protein